MEQKIANRWGCNTHTHTHRSSNGLRKNNQQGITLIGLAITIIVIIVLVGVAISLVVGNNGVVDKSSGAIVTNRQAKAQEEVEMAWASAHSRFMQEWALDTSKEIGDYYSNLTLLNGFIKDTGRIISSDDNEDGTWIVQYIANDQGATYTFIMDGEGNARITENIKVTVTYDANGGSFADEDIKTKSVIKGERIRTFPTEPSRTDYTFKGWYTDSNSGDKFDISSTLMSDLILYAGWEYNKCIIEFDANAGNGEMAEQIINKNEDTIINENVFSKDNMIFKEWNTKADGSGDNYSDKGTINLSANTKLYAIWIDATAPIVNITGASTGNVIFNASDPESGIAGFAITNTNVQPEEFTAWDGSSKTQSVTVNTDQYLWVKNNDEMIAESKRFQVHGHTGSSSSGGGCYTTPIYHAHSTNCRDKHYLYLVSKRWDNV